MPKFAKGEYRRGLVIDCPTFVQSLQKGFVRVCVDPYHYMMIYDDGTVSTQPYGIIGGSSLRGVRMCTATEARMVGIHDSIVKDDSK
jgi:hypothetical protein